MATQFLRYQKAFLLTTAAQNIRDLRPKSPLRRKHFFKRLKTAVLLVDCGTSTLKSPPPRAFVAPHVHPRPRKRLSRCTLDCGFQTSESPALRGFVGRLRALATAALYLLLKSNGPHRSKSLPVKFGFSPKIVPANIAKKLPLQRCSKPLFIAFSNLSHKRPAFAFTGESGYTHSPSPTGSHTAAHMSKQGSSLPRSQRSLVLPAKSLLFHHAFIYIHFPVLCEPPLSAEGEIRRNCRHKFYPQPFLIPVFNFSHKRPTFAFTGESGHTLDSPRKITHNGARRNRGPSLLRTQSGFLLPARSLQAE